MRRPSGLPLAKSMAQRQAGPGLDDADPLVVGVKHIVGVSDRERKLQDGEAWLCRDLDLGEVLQDPADLERLCVCG